MAAAGNVIDYIFKFKVKSFWGQVQGFLGSTCAYTQIIFIYFLNVYNRIYYYIGFKHSQASKQLKNLVSGFCLTHTIRDNIIICPVYRKYILCYGKKSLNKFFVSMVSNTQQQIPPNTRDIFITFNSASSRSFAFVGEQFIYLCFFFFFLALPKIKLGCGTTPTPMSMAISF